MSLRDKKYWSIAFGLIALTAVILFSMGRVPFYENGPISLWSGDINSDQNSQQLIDPYTFTHIIHGFLLYLFLWLVFGEKIPFGAKLALAIGLECGWEILENSNFIIDRYRETTISLNYYGDSILNSIGDILACGIGFIIALKLRTWMTILLAILLEVVLFIWIRDGLLINIIMLLYPIPAIKTWQTGS